MTDKEVCHRPTCKKGPYSNNDADLVLFNLLLRIYSVFNNKQQASSDKETNAPTLKQSGI